MKKFRSIFIAFASLFLSVGVFAQSEEKEYSPVDISLQLKTKHLWRGIQVSNEALAAADLTFQDKSGSFKAGVWGGAGFAGNFKEFDYFASYSKSGFTIALWDIYNFANDNKRERNLFNYNKYTTGHFIDLSVAYQLQGSFPLSLSWATIIQGCDLDQLNPESDNRYSTYVTLGYPVIRNKAVDLDLGIGGAFALNPAKGSDVHFYGDKPGIVNLNATASKKVQLGSYTLPVSVMAMWNPLMKHGNIQVALDIF